MFVHACLLRPCSFAHWNINQMTPAWTLPLYRSCHCWRRKVKVTSPFFLVMRPKIKKHCTKAQKTQGIGYIDSFNHFISKQKLWNLSQTSAWFGKGWETHISTLTNSYINFDNPTTLTNTNLEKSIYICINFEKCNNINKIFTAIRSMMTLHRTCLPYGGKSGLRW